MTKERTKTGAGLNQNKKRRKGWEKNKKGRKTSVKKSEGNEKKEERKENRKKGEERKHKMQKEKKRGKLHDRKSIACWRFLKQIFESALQISVSGQSISCSQGDPPELVT